MADRRTVLLSWSRYAAGFAAGGLAIAVTANGKGRGAKERAVERLSLLQGRSGGRLGVCVFEPSSGRSFGLNMSGRFGMCSTFKLLLAGAVLLQADRGLLDLDERIPFGAADLLGHAPVARANLEQGWLTTRQLAEAAQVTSDNTAANLLLRRLGGPEALTTLLRGLGDRVTRLDRYEPELNVVPAGELQDTTTPRAFAKSAAAFTAGDVLSPTSRAQLVAWMINTTTGLARIRAGIPADWRAGDKTGTGMHPRMPNRHNDVAIAWPTGKAPLVISAFYEAPGHFAEQRPQDDAVLAEVGRIVADWISG